MTGRWVPTQEPCFNYWTEQLYCEYPPFLELPDGSFHGRVQPSLGRGSSGKLGSMLTPIYTGLWDLRGGSPFRRDTCPFTASLRRRLLQRRARMARVRDQSPWKGRPVWRQVSVAAVMCPLASSSGRSYCHMSSPDDHSTSFQVTLIWPETH